MDRCSIEKNPQLQLTASCLKDIPDLQFSSFLGQCFGLGNPMLGLGSNEPTWLKKTA